MWDLYDPDTIEAMRFIAVCLRNQGGFDEAETLFRATIDALIRVRGSAHEDTLSAQFGLAKTYQLAGNVLGANEIFSVALKNSIASLGEEHEMTKDLKEALLAF